MDVKEVCNDLSNTCSKAGLVTCSVCMETFDETNTDGIFCPNDHYVCRNDLIPYLAENVFPNIYKLRAKRCAIMCPVQDCKCFYNSIILFSMMPPREKSRYLSILNDTVVASDRLMQQASSSYDSDGSVRKAYKGNDVNLLRSALLDVMTLRCPQCKTTVDPYPDACSAVMCLNCGNHYCNYCFAGFATGQLERDRAAAHSHAAVHNDSIRPEGRDAFLSQEAVEKGHRIHQGLQVEKCLSLAMCSLEYGVDGRHSVALALILCFSELQDLSLDMVDLWRAADARAQERMWAASSSSSSSSRRGRESVVPCLTPLKSGGGGVGSGSVGHPSNPTSADDVFDMEEGESDDGDDGDGNCGDGGVAFATRKRVHAPRRGDHNDPNPLNNNASTNNDLRILTNTINNNNAFVSDTPHTPTSSVLSLQRTLADPVKGDSVQRSLPIDQQESYRVRRQGAMQLANAIITSNVAAIAQILHNYGSKIDLDYVDSKYGHPVVALAVLSGLPKVAIDLLDRGADPFKTNSSGRSVLYIAIEAGSASVFACIMNLYPHIDLARPISSEMQQYTSVHVAARYNHGHILRSLIQLGADLDVKEKEHGYTPLTLALVIGNEWAARELILAGAKCRKPCYNGRTPMFVAAEKGFTELIRLMVEHSQIDVNEAVVQPTGLRLLHVAAFHRQPQVVSLLVGLGADVNCLDDEGGYGPLTMALIGANIAGALTLIAAGADPRNPSKSGRSPLYVASEKGLSEIVRIFIVEKGIDINAPVTNEASQVTPLHVVILHGQSYMLPMLISLGADVNAVEKEKNCSPIIMATILQDEWALQRLVEAGADVSCRSKEGRTALYVAVEKGHSGIVKMLIKDCGLDINAPATNEYHLGSALHVAALFNNIHIVHLLLSLGADPLRRDALGRVPSAIAREAGNAASLFVLVSFMKEKLAMEGCEYPPDIMREIMLASAPEGAAGGVVMHFDIADDVTADAENAVLGDADN